MTLQRKVEKEQQIIKIFTWNIFWSNEEGPLAALAYLPLQEPT